MTRTETGRIRSTGGPELQNIPIRAEAGRRIRDCLVPATDRCFTAMDYSQIERRILAYAAGKP